MDGSYDPNGTEARQGILVQSTGLHSLRQTQCLHTCLRCTSPQSQHGQTGLTTRTTRGRVVSTITTWSNGSYNPNDTGACRLHNHNIVKRVLRPERHEGATSPQSQHDQTGLTTRTTRGRVVSTITIWSNGSYDPNDTRACRLHNHSTVKRVWRPERHEGVSSQQSLHAQTFFIWSCKSGIFGTKRWGIEVWSMRDFGVKVLGVIINGFGYKMGIFGVWQG